MKRLSRCQGFPALLATLAVGLLLSYIVSAKVTHVRAVLAPATAASGDVLAAGSKGGGHEPGQSIFLSQCASCHGRSGKGDGWTAWLFRLKMRDFTDLAYMRTLPDDYLIQIIKHGGASLGKPGMPSWGQELADTEIKELAVYIRSLAQPPTQPQHTGTPR